MTPTQGRVDMRRLFLAVMVSIAGLGATSCQQAPDLPASSQIGTTIAVDPAATIEKQIAQLQSPVKLNDLLETSVDGAIRVQFVDETFFSLGANASMRIDSFVFDPQRGASKLSLDFARGAFRFVSGKPVHAYPGQPAIKTPVAVIGIRGTGVSGVIGPQAEALFRQIEPSYVPDGGDASTATLILLTDGAIDVTGSGVTETLDRPGQLLFFRRRGEKPIGPVFVWSGRRAQIDALVSPPSLGPEPGAVPPTPVAPSPTPSAVPSPVPVDTRPSPTPTPTLAPTPEPSPTMTPRRPPWQRPTPLPTYRPPADVKPTPRPTYRPPIDVKPTPRPRFRPPVTRATPVPTPRPTFRPNLTSVPRVTPTPTATTRPKLTPVRIKPTPTPTPTNKRAPVIR
jgi:hypothetical protein